MASSSVIRFPDMTPILTPPPSDRGECEDTAMLHSDPYLPEVYYPSPAPSFSHQHPKSSSSLSSFPHSPDMGHSDSTTSSYDTEEDNAAQQMFFVNAASAPHHHSSLYNDPTTSSLHNASLYSTTTTMPYHQSYEPSSWGVSYGSYPNTTSMFSFNPPDESAGAMYSPYISQAPSSIIPPIPQSVTGGSFNFNEPVSRPDQSGNSMFIKAYPNPSIRHQTPPTAPSTNSIMSGSGVSSRSCSPNLSSMQAQHQQLSDSQQHNGRRPSLLSHHTHRSSTSQSHSHSASGSSSSLHAYGIPIRTPDSSAVQAWRCAFPSCTSRAVFTRGCDLRKHYNRHSKHLFCRVEGCPQSEAACIALAQQQALQAGEPLPASGSDKLAVSGGFSSKKDRARHEAKHNPGIKCEWRGPAGEECGRLFSRMDNMKDHVRRIHNKGQQGQQSSQVIPHQQQSSPTRKKSIGQ